MPKYKVTYYEQFYSTKEIYTDTPDEAEAIFWKGWENDDVFVDDVLSAREVVHSELEVE